MILQFFTSSSGKGGGGDGSSRNGSGNDSGNGSSKFEKDEQYCEFRMLKTLSNVNRGWRNIVLNSFTGK